MSEDEDGGGGGGIRQDQTVYNGRRQRKPISRRWIDHHMSFALYCQDIPFGTLDKYPQNIARELRTLYPPFAYDNCGVDITARIIRASTNKNGKSPVNAMAWQPDGKRLVAGYEAGVITLWNGMAFQFDILMKNEKEPSPDVPVWELIWSNHGDYMLTVDDNNMLKVWQSNYEVIAQWRIHEKRVRQLTFSPCDRKFASCSDDTKIKIWDLATHKEERELSEHGCDVKTIDWHPSRSLIASGAKDTKLRLMDPRDGKSLSTLTIHKGLVHKLQWNQNGNWLLSCGKDSMVKLVDIRMMRELMSFQGHEKEVLTVTWHPTQEDLFVSGGFTGEMYWWAVGCEKPLYGLPAAHKHAIFQLRYHPLGHILASTGKEGAVKFWARNRAGDDEAAMKTDEPSLVVATGAPSSMDIPGLDPYSTLF